MVLPHPGGDERGQREPNNKCRFATGCHRNHASLPAGVMMVVPVDPDVDETQDIAEENRKEWLQGRKTGSLWRLHLQHHDGDDDGDTPSLKASMRPLVILPTPSVDLRVKRQQPVYWPLPPTPIALASTPGFRKRPARLFQA